jgi:hypothetical protein
MPNGIARAASVSVVFFLCVIAKAKRRIPDSFSLAFSLCHSEPLRRRIPQVFLSAPVVLSMSRGTLT